tara:strand:+ start:608 stop:1480 length:873 start_codon:yes stop_codon:yes gene_type:complete
LIIKIGDKMTTFNYAKYNSEGNIQDSSDAYANAGFVISFYHVITGQSLKFKAYITNFNESYSSDFAAEPVFGRADPIYAFRNTTRQVNLTFQAPASSTGEAYENLAKAQKLIQFLYPAYKNLDNNNALTIAQSPLVRLKVMNLLSRPQGFNNSNPSEVSNSALYDNYITSDEPTNGVLGALTGVTVMHNMENADIGVFEKTNNTILPKVIEIQLNFAPIHEHPIGWEDGTFSEPSFPYGANIGVGLSGTANEIENLLSQEPSADRPAMTDAEFDEVMAQLDEILEMPQGI